jgi:hypothetical protein
MHRRLSRSAAGCRALGCGARLVAGLGLGVADPNDRQPCRLDHILQIVRPQRRKPPPSGSQHPTPQPLDRPRMSTQRQLPRRRNGAHTPSGVAATNLDPVNRRPPLPSGDGPRLSPRTLLHHGLVRLNLRLLSKALLVFDDNGATGEADMHKVTRRTGRSRRGASENQYTASRRARCPQGRRIQH